MIQNEKRVAISIGIYYRCWNAYCCFGGKKKEMVNDERRKEKKMRCSSMIGEKKSHM